MNVASFLKMIPGANALVRQYMPVRAMQLGIMLPDIVALNSDLAQLAASGTAIMQACINEKRDASPEELAMFGSRYQEFVKRFSDFHTKPRPTAEQLLATAESALNG